MRKPLHATQVLKRAREAMINSLNIDLTAIPKSQTRDRALIKKRGFLREASDYASRFSGQRGTPPGCTLDMQREATQIYNTCQACWPDPNTLPDVPEPYDGEVLDIEVVLKLVGPTFVQPLESGERHCWVSDKAGGIITESILKTLAALDPALSGIWRSHEISGLPYSQIVRQTGLMREKVRQLSARAARLCRGDLVRSGKAKMIPYAIEVTYIPFGELDPDWWSVKRAAEETGYSTWHLRLLINAGKLEAQKVRGAWKIQRSSLIAYAAATKKVR